MKAELSNGCFSLMGVESYDFENFSKVIVSWSLEGMKNSHIDATECGISKILQSRSYSPVPLSAVLMSYHTAIYIVMLIEYSGYPLDHFEELKKAIVLEICDIKTDRDAPIFSEKEGGLMEFLVHKYVLAVGESLNSTPEALSLGPGGVVFEDVKDLYELEDASLDIDARYKFPMLLNSKISATFKGLIEEGQCKWEPTRSIVETEVRGKDQIIHEFELTDEEFSRCQESYRFSLGVHESENDWNADIDEYARSINALTDNEIVLAKFNFERAVLNRIIMRFAVARSIT